MSAPAVHRAVVVRHEEGFHARPCTAIATLAKRYRSRLRLAHGGVEADGRSVFELMMLQVAGGDTVEVAAEGADAEALVAAVVALVESDFEG